jgi:hypothetical protein
MLQLLSGLYLVFAAIVAFGVGGYLAGRMRSPVGGSDDEIEFRDGSLGVLSWAVAIVLTVLMTWAAAQSLARVAGQSGGPGAVQSVAGENLIAYDLTSFRPSGVGQMLIWLTQGRKPRASC